MITNFWVCLVLYLMFMFLICSGIGTALTGFYFWVGIFPAPEVNMAVVSIFLIPFLIFVWVTLQWLV